MPTRDVIVVGASAGGVSTLKRLASLLPENLPAAVLVAQHIAADSPRYLADILSRAGPLPASYPSDATPISPGQIFIAPPDHHLLVREGQLRVVRGPKENLHRPAIDPLFRSAAWSYGPRVIGVVLTGTRDDGVSGLWAVQSLGGITVVQDPADALYPELPRNALARMQVDYCLTIEDIAKLLARLTGETIGPEAHEAPKNLQTETEFAMGNQDLSDMKQLGEPSGYGCPTCGGALWEVRDGEFVRFRCHIGHAFQAPSLLAEQTRGVDEALEAAMRALNEKASLLARLAARSAEFPFPQQGKQYEERARAARDSADSLRSLLAELRT